MKKNMQMLVVIGLLAVLLLGGGTGFFFATQDLGYSTAFEGPKPSFVGIKYGGKKYSQIGTTIVFDPDGATDGKPNLLGEMTSVFVPETSPFSASWVPVEWLRKNQYIDNPRETYTWNISGKTYKMEQWLMKFYLSFSAEWDSDYEISPAGSWGFDTPGEVSENYFSNTEVWLKFDIKPTWYIQGGGTAYFAIAKLQVSDVEKGGKDNSGNPIAVDPKLSVSPESSGAILYLHYGAYGTSDSAEKVASTFEGKELNPDYFTDSVYAKLTFNHFGVIGWNEAFTQKRRGDAIKLGFDVTVFVIGEWKVQDIQEIPEDFGRTVKTEMQPSLLDYFKDPKIQALITLLVGIGIFVLLLIFAPWVLIAIFALFTGGRRKR